MRPFVLDHPQEGPVLEVEEQHGLKLYGDTHLSL